MKVNNNHNNLKEAKNSNIHKNNKDKIKTIELNENYEKLNNTYKYYRKWI